MVRETLTPKNVAMIAIGQGTGGLILDLHLTDFTRGVTTPVVDDDGMGHRSFWLTDGRRVDLAAHPRHGTVTAGVTSEPDPDRPEPLVTPEQEEVIRRFAEAIAIRLGIEYTCGHPDCAARAARMGWPRAYHKSNTKIGREHLPYRKQEA